MGHRQSVFLKLTSTLEHFSQPVSLFLKAQVSIFFPSVCQLKVEFNPDTMFSRDAIQRQEHIDMVQTAFTPDGAVRAIIV